MERDRIELAVKDAADGTAAVDSAATGPATRRLTLAAGFRSPMIDSGCCGYHAADDRALAA